MWLHRWKWGLSRKCGSEIQADKVENSNFRGFEMSSDSDSLMLFLPCVQFSNMFLTYKYVFWSVLWKGGLTAFCQVQRQSPVFRLDPSLTNAFVSPALQRNPLSITHHSPRNTLRITMVNFILRQFKAWA